MRYQHRGGAKPSTLATATTSSGPSQIVLDVADGWPDANFFIVFERGTINEEKALVASRVGLTLTMASRGADDTVGIAHPQGATVEHVFTAMEADQANAHIEATSGVHGLPPSVDVASKQEVTDASTADRAYSDAADDTHSTADRAYADQRVVADRPATYTDLARGATAGDPSQQTPIFKFKFPAGTDPLQVARALQVLAEGMEVELPQILHGTAAPPTSGMRDGDLYLRHD